MGRFVIVDLQDGVEGEMEPLLAQFFGLDVPAPFRAVRAHRLTLRPHCSDLKLLAGQARIHLVGDLYRSRLPFAGLMNQAGKFFRRFVCRKLQLDLGGSAVAEGLRRIERDIRRLQSFEKPIDLARRGGGFVESAGGRFEDPVRLPQEG